MRPTNWNCPDAPLPPMASVLTDWSTPHGTPPRAPTPRAIDRLLAGLRALASALLLMLVAGLALVATTAHAGRPLVVDDAGTNDAGHGHVEAWAERADGATVWNIAPAYAPVDGLEFALAHGRVKGQDERMTAISVKALFSASREDGCNAGVSAGLARMSPGSLSGRAVTLLGTCNGVAGGSVHLNLGLNKATGMASVTIWGVAYEREWGPVTPHIEFFGAEGLKPVVQVGLRAEVAPGWQLDGTVGRSDGQTLTSLGMKFSF